MVHLTPWRLATEPAERLVSEMGEIRECLGPLGWEIELPVEQLEAGDARQAAITLEMLNDKLEEADK